MVKLSKKQLKIVDIVEEKNDEEVGGRKKSPINSDVEELNNINPEETDKNIALTNLIKGFKKTHDNIHFDLLDSYYESQNPNIEEKIIERLEGLVKLMRIFIEFEK